MGCAIMDINHNVKNFWETKHKVKDKAALSGCFYEETIDFMCLNAYVSKGKRVLEVGVGLGYVTKGLFEVEALVSALDISDTSLERIKDYCEALYTLDELYSLPTDCFDVIICNNVVQHISTDLLTEELKVLINSLNKDGVFAVEFVSNKGFSDNGQEPSVEEIKNGGLCRSPEFLESLINDVGGKCETVFSKEVDLGIVQGHHVLHIRRK